MARRTRLVGVRPARRGFTLVELLVVISIIGMLAALLLPAVNQAREAGRRSVCTNNQRQIGLAIFQYDQKQGRYPGYVNAQAVSSGQASRPVGWLFSLMTYLERNDINDNYGTPSLTSGNAVFNFGNSQLIGPYYAPNLRLKIAICPSDARAETKNAGSAHESQAGCSYVVNCGMKDFDPTYGTSPSFAQDSNGNPIPRDWPGNGVFHFNYPYLYTGTTPSTLGDVLYTSAPSTLGGGSGEPLTSVSSSFVSSGDGTSTTLMMSENVDSGQWTNVWESRVGFVWQAGLNGTAPAPVTFTGDNIGGLASTNKSLLYINQNVGLVDSSTGFDTYAYARPSAYHPGGVVATFCDAHTTFINETIDYGVYAQLMTPRAKAAELAPSATSSNNTTTFFAPFGPGNPYTRPLTEGSY